MQEVSAVCDRVMIINKGRIVAQGTPEHLSASLTKSSGKIQVRVRASATQAREALKDYSIIRHIEAIGSREPNTIDLELGGDEGADIREAVFRCMAKHNLPLLLMKSMDLSLEEIFLTLTGDLRAAAAGYDGPESEIETETEIEPETTEGGGENALDV
jgi:ABC-2 type transport system ATP-binding protein